MAKIKYRFSLSQEERDELKGIVARFPSHWHWQLKNSITDVETFEKLLNIELEPFARRKVELTMKKFPMSITP